MVIDYRRRNTNQLYIMESETLIKIGISSDTGKRLNSLNSRLGHQDRFKIIKVKFYESYFDARNAEKLLHIKYRHANVLTEYIGAKTECFSKEILSQLLEDFDQDGATYSYDPFIYVKKDVAVKVLGVTFLEVYRRVSLGKGGRVSNYIDTIDTCLKNLAANILMSKGRKIFYNTNVMEYFTPSGRFTPLFMEMFEWERFTSKLPACDICINEVRMFNLVNPPPFLQRYSKVTRGYLMSIESLWDDKLNVHQKARYFKNVKTFILS